MNMFHPLLAAAIIGPSDPEELLQERLRKLTYPVGATPKFDGIRCTTIDEPGGKFPSLPIARSMKRIPNDHIRETIAQLDPGFDGEIMTYDAGDLLDATQRTRGFNEVQSDVMSFGGTPLFKYHVFDCAVLSNQHSYQNRTDMLACAELPSWCVKVLPTICNSPEELQDFMAQCIADGHEGCCFRTMNSPAWKRSSKDGRSTLREQWLVKWKLFHTSEAVIIGFEEEMHNANAPVIGLKGLQERSSHRANMVGKGRLGALIVSVPGDGEVTTFKIGTGFTAQQRQDLWDRRTTLIDQVVTFKSQSHGVHERPRIPIFVGIRSRVDIS
jgi:DNA ligase-1